MGLDDSPKCHPHIKVDDKIEFMLLGSKMPKEDFVIGITRTEEAALEYLIKVGVIRVPVVCGVCAMEVKRWYSKKDPLGQKVRCTRKAEHNKTIFGHRHWVSSIRVGSILEGSRLKYGWFIRFVYKWLLGTPRHSMVTQLGGSSETHADWHNYLTEVVSVCMDRRSERARQIGGPGIIVQIDESKFGKRKYHKGKRVEGCWVFGGVEHIYHENMKKWCAGRCFATVVPDRKRDTLLPILFKHVKAGSKIHSDAWKAYIGMEKYPGYTYAEHKVVVHEKEYKSADGTHTNTCEGMWYSTFKKDIANNKYNAYALPGELLRCMWKREVTREGSNLWTAFMYLLANVEYDRKLNFTGTPPRTPPKP